MCFATVFESYWTMMVQMQDELEYASDETIRLWWVDVIYSDIYKQFPELEDELNNTINNFNLT